MKTNKYTKRHLSAKLLLIVLTLACCGLEQSTNVFLTKCLASQQPSTPEFDIYKDPLYIAYSSKIGIFKNIGLNVDNELSKIVMSTDALNLLEKYQIINKAQRNELAHGTNLKDARLKLDIFSTDIKVHIYHFLTTAELMGYISLQRTATAEEAQNLTIQQGTKYYQKLANDQNLQEFKNTLDNSKVFSAAKYATQGVTTICTAYGTYKVLDLACTYIAQQLGYKNPNTADNTLELYQGDLVYCHRPNNIENLYHMITVNTINKEYFLHARSSTNNDNSEDWKFFHCKLPNLVLLSDISNDTYGMSPVLSPLNDILLGLNIKSKNLNNITQIVVYDNPGSALKAKEKVLYPIAAAVADGKLKRARSSNYYYSYYNVSFDINPATIQLNNVVIKNKLTSINNPVFQLLGREIEPKKVTENSRINSYSNLLMSTLFDKTCLLGEKNQGWHKHTDGKSKTFTTEDIYGCISANIHSGSSFIVLSKINLKETNTVYNTYHVFLDTHDMKNFTNALIHEPLITGNTSIGFTALKSYETNEAIILRILKSVIEKTPIQYQYPSNQQDPNSNSSQNTNIQLSQAENVVTNNNNQYPTTNTQPPIINNTNFNQQQQYNLYNNPPEYNYNNLNQFDNNNYYINPSSEEE